MTNIQAQGALSALYSMGSSSSGPRFCQCYNEHKGQANIDVIWWVFKELRKHGLFANLKICQFYKNKVRFLGYAILSQGIWIKDERIKAVKNWPEPKLMKDIQVFLDFANFYLCFIQGINKIAGPVIFMLRTSSTTRSFKNLLILIDVAKSVKVTIGGGSDCENKTVRKSLLMPKNFDKTKD